jgi:hypothetical protein
LLEQPGRAPGTLGGSLPDGALGVDGRKGVTLPDGAGFQTSAPLNTVALQDTDSEDLHDLINDGWHIKRRGTVDGNDGTPGFAGQITLERAGEQALLIYSDVDKMICFTPGTRIAGPRGEIAVEDLRPGDKVFTRDNGTQRIRWIGTRHLPFKELRRSPHWAPVLIRKGALGDGLPERDMLVSPNHRMLLNTHGAETEFGTREVLVPAKYLTCLDGISRSGSGQATYIHLLFDDHELIIANGAWSESFQPSPRALNALSDEERADVEKLCPTSGKGLDPDIYATARRSLKRTEAARLLG